MDSSTRIFSDIFDRIAKPIIRCGSLIVFLFLVGCGHTYKTDFAMKADYLSGINRVAVLPLENLTTTPEAGSAVTDLLLTELHKVSEFQVFGKVELEQMFQEKNIYLPKLIDRGIATEIGKRIEADAIFIGSVSEYLYRSDSMPDEEQEPAVGINLRLVDARTGTIIWGASCVRSSYEVFTYEKDPLSRVATKTIQKMLSSL